jgi:hypothetical protein
MTEKRVSVVKSYFFFLFLPPKILQLKNGRTLKNTHIKEKESKKINLYGKNFDCCVFKLRKEIDLYI